MHPLDDRLQTISRRQLIQRLGYGMGALALTSLLNPESLNSAPNASSNKASSARGPHFAPKARSIIYLHMVGAPSQLDLFENKPVLTKHNGQLVPKHLIEGQRFAFLRGQPKLLGTPYRFARHGRSGIEMSELVPHLATVADDLTVIKTLQTNEFNHAPAQLLMHTGFSQFGRPGMGSWVAYGLGSENENLPAFVVLVSGHAPGAGTSLWGSGFLPSAYQGVQFRNSGDPVLFLTDPPGMTRDDRRGLVDAIGQLNHVALADVGDPEIATRIAQYELAFRMQAAVPELTDLSREPQRILDQYGVTPGRPSFANNCLLARRLVERGVRFVQLFDAEWDHHSAIFKDLPGKCRDVDKPTAALIKDLKQRGLLDSTLVIWAGEFGRTPMMQGDPNDPKPGRDHHKEAFCALLAGGGVKAGYVHGQSDDLGYFPTEDPMHVHDLQATILHLLGIDHERLTFRHQGRDFRLTDVEGEVTRKVLA